MQSIGKLVDLVRSQLAVLPALVFLVASSSFAQEATIVQGNFVNAGNGKIYYEERGNGVPLLLLHGFGRTSADWRPLTETLSQKFRVIAMDLPGHGQSDPMTEDEFFQHKKAAHAIIDALTTLRIDTAYVFGHSSGAIIALHMAAMQPEHIRKIVVASAQLYYSPSTRKMISAEAEPGKGTMNNMQNLEKLHGKQKAEMLANQFWNFRKQYDDPAFTPDVLAAIEARCLIIHGDNDPIAPLFHAFEMHRHMRNANLWVVPFGGHINLMGPANRTEMARQVLFFLTRTF